MITFKKYIYELTGNKCDWCHDPGATSEDIMFGKGSNINLCDSCRQDMYQKQDKRMIDMLSNISNSRKGQNQERERNLGTNTGY